MMQTDWLQKKGKEAAVAYECFFLLTRFVEQVPRQKLAALIGYTDMRYL